MAVTFKQVSTVQTKLEARNSVDLQKLYRELSTTGNETQKAIDILQRLTKAVSEVGTLGQIVAAIHGEATAATLKELMAEGDSMGLQLPASLAKMQSARALVELSVGGEWERYLALLQGGEIASLFGDDKDGLADFQFCSLKNSVCKWLQQETAVPSSTEPKATDGKAQVVTEEQKAERERQHREATKCTELGFGGIILFQFIPFCSVLFLENVESYHAGHILANSILSSISLGISMPDSSRTP